MIHYTAGLKRLYYRLNETRATNPHSQPNLLWCLTASGEVEKILMENHDEKKMVGNMLLRVQLKLDITGLALMKMSRNGSVDIKYSANYVYVL